MREELLRSFEKRVGLSHLGDFRRVVAEPFRTIPYYLATRFAPRLGITFVATAKTFWGEDMKVVLPEGISSTIYLNEYFEEGLTRMVLEYLDEGMTFCDVGAHFGYYTLLGSLIVGKSGQVHAFEPTPRTYKYLLANVKGKTNVTINNSALFSKCTTLSLKDFGIMYAAYNSLTTPRLSERDVNRAQIVELLVKAITLDEYVRERNIQPDFVKIDAEYAEYEILMGMEETIERYHPITTVEVGDSDLQGVKRSRELIQHLIARGYSAYEYSCGRMVQHQPREKYGFNNLLFLYE